MAWAPNPSVVLSFEDARSIVESHARQCSAITVESDTAEIVDLLQTSGRILAESIPADRDIPPFPRSTRDGYAVQSADLADLPAALRLMGEIKAGPQLGKPEPTVNPGEAYAIMTGAPVPPGADGVVMIEYTSVQGDHVEIAKSIGAGDNVVAQGAEAKCGIVLLDRGTKLNEAAIALAASVGRSRLRVFVRPRIAVLATGDEIVAIGGGISRTQIRNSNSYSLAVQIQQAGATPVLLPIAPDEPRRLRELIEQGLRFDLLLMTGGVSMGRYDLVEQVLAEMQAEFLFTGAKIQPGRPIVFGRIPCGKGPVNKHPSAPPAHNYFFGLPGNPISTMVTFELFVLPMIESLTGMEPRRLRFLHARVKSEIRVKTGLKRFLPAILSGAYEHSQVELVPWHGSGDIAAQSRSNCLIVIPPDREQIAAGDWVAVMPRE